MNSLFLPTSVTLQLPASRSSTCHQLVNQIASSSQVRNVCFIPSIPCKLRSALQYSLHVRQSSIGATASSDEGAVSIMDFEDFIEKDWSFLDSDDLYSKENQEKIGRIISAGGIKENSRVLVSVSSENFVDRLVETSPGSFLLVNHDSLFQLAMIKEKYDEVKCWQGELIYVPEKWAPFDTVFLYFLPALPFELDKVFESLAKRCSPGTRVVISHPQGREMLQQQRKQHQDVVITDLPDKVTVQKAGAIHSFEIGEFVDEPEFYLAVLQFSGKENKFESI